jgi:hypothetical protein
MKQGPGHIHDSGLCKMLRNGAVAVKDKCSAPLFSNSVNI